MSEHNQSEPTVSNAFARFLSELRDGEPLTELTKAMQQCVAAARDTTKAATMTLKVTFVPSGDAVAVSYEVNTKLPMEKMRPAVFFANENNTLQRNNPAQRQLELKEVEKPEVRELKTVSA